jgi:hypothetical protein
MKPRARPGERLTSHDFFRLHLALTEEGNTMDIARVPPFLPQITCGKLLMKLLHAYLGDIHDGEYFCISLRAVIQRLKCKQSVCKTMMKTDRDRLRP